VNLIYDHTDPVVSFGVEQIKSSLKRKGVYFVERFLEHGAVPLPQKGIVVRKTDGRGGRPGGSGIVPQSGGAAGGFTSRVRIPAA